MDSTDNPNRAFYADNKPRFALYRTYGKPYEIEVELLAVLLFVGEFQDCMYFMEADIKDCNAYWITPSRHDIAGDALWSGYRLEHPDYYPVTYECNGHLPPRPERSVAEYERWYMGCEEEEPEFLRLRNSCRYCGLLPSAHSYEECQPPAPEPPTMCSCGKYTRSGMDHEETCERYFPF